MLNVKKENKQEYLFPFGLTKFCSDGKGFIHLGLGDLQRYFSQ
jgi:hypothetical protein